METITIPVNEYNDLINFKKNILTITKKELKNPHLNTELQYEKVTNEEQKEIEKLHFDILKDKFDRSDYLEL